MAKTETPSPVRGVSYDAAADILTLAFTETPQPALAEEAADDVWVRYDQQTRHIISVDILNFSVRVNTPLARAWRMRSGLTPSASKGYSVFPQSPQSELAYPSCCG